MSDNTTGTPSRLKQIILAVNIGYNDNGFLRGEVICSKGFDKDHPEAIKITEKHAEAWYNDILEYSNKVVNGGEEE